MDREPLKIGVMCRSFDLPNWQIEVMERVVEKNLGIISLVIHDVTPGRKAPAKSRFSALGALPFRVYRKFLVAPKVKIQATQNASSFFSDVPKLECVVTTKGKFSEYFSEQDIASIESHQLDIILRFEFGIIRGKIHQAAKYGVWSYHHDDEREFRGAPPCFWPIFHRRSTSGAILQRLNNKLDAGVVLRRGDFPTQATYAQNLELVYRGAVPWVASAMSQIQNGDTSFLQLAPSSTKAPIVFTPNPVEMLVFAAKQACRAISKNLKRCFFHDIWNVGFSNTTPEELIATGLTEDIKWCPQPPRGEYYADPFVMNANGQDQILFEHYRYSTGKGDIGVVSIAGEAFGNIEALIESPFHLSYPFVLNQAEKTFCLPESAEAQKALCYRYDHQKNRFVESDEVRFDLPVIDGTFILHEGYWWIIGGKPGTAFYELHAWFSESLQGPWTSHPLNPLKVSAENTRSAGPLFFVKGKLYRPSQRCIAGYGTGISLNLVEKLTTTEFSETTIQRIRPVSPYNAGIHTVTPFRGGLVIDGKIEKFSLLTSWLRLQNYLRAKERRAAMKRLPTTDTP
jgi:hypothetical protein